MRTANFRDAVLWPLAYRCGADPQGKGLLKSQANAYASFINAWVRRLWDQADFPEWSIIEPRTADPNTHIVPYAGPAFTPVGVAPHILSVVLKVYLVDPRLQPDPVDWPFKLLAEGIHVGFIHGPTVWIKYLPLAPIFTAQAWDPTVTYGRGALVYSPVTGECYKSLSANNIGNDPSVAFSQVPVSVINQKYLPPTNTHPGSNAIWTFTPSEPIPPWYNQAGTTYHISLYDQTGAAHSFNYTTPAAGGTQDNVLDGLIAAAQASSDPFITSLAITKDSPSYTLTIQLATGAFADAGSNSTSGSPALGPSARPMTTKQVQQYTPSVAAAAASPQITVLNLTPAGQYIPGALYTIVINDADTEAHVVQYQSLSTDGVTEVINGLLAAFNQPGDDCLQSLVVTPDYNALTLSIASNELISVDASVMAPTPGGIPSPNPVPPGPSPAPASPWWDEIFFPLALVDQVIRGAYADAAREGGQEGKAGAEEQIVPTEQSTVTGKILAPAYDPLTDQEKVSPRYRIG